MKVLKEFICNFDFVRMRPDNSVIRTAPPKAACKGIGRGGTPIRAVHLRRHKG